MGKINIQKMLSEGAGRYVKKTADYVKRYGVKDLVAKTMEKYQRSADRYGEVYRKFLPAQEELEAQEKEVFPNMPLISVVVPAYETEESYLRQMADSVLRQTYANWELVVADGSDSDKVEKVMEEYAGLPESGKIRYSRLEDNAGISANTNEAIKQAAGEYIGFLDHDDFLERNALYEMVKRINEAPQAELFYSDEDKVSADVSEYMQPHFKPDFNAELLRSNNYICHFLVTAKTLLDRVGFLNPEYDGAQDYDLVLRCSEQAARIEHIAKILYHWRIHDGSTAVNTGSKLYAYEAGKNAILAHLERIGEPQDVKLKADLGFYRVMYYDDNFRQLTVLIAERQKEEPKELLELKKIGVTVKYIASDTTPMVCMITTRYGLILKKMSYLPKKKELAEMMGILKRKEVAAVGTKSVSSNGRILQNGLVFFENGLVRPAFEQLKKNYKGYMRRAELTQYADGISFSCAMIKKEALEMTGGFLKRLPSDYRDMDFCLQLKKAGYKVVQDSYISVEAKEEQEYSRVEENQARLMLRERWGAVLKNGDIFYNPNFDRGNAQFAIQAR